MSKIIKHLNVAKKHNLTLNEYWKAVGTDVLIEVCFLAETSFLYFRALAYYAKPCSPKMYQRLALAVAKETPEFSLGYVVCTSPTEREKALKLRARLKKTAASADKAGSDKVTK